MRNRLNNRSEAGRLLAKGLLHLRGRQDVLVLALPRGGVPVAFEIAKELKAPLDVLLVRKLGTPGQEELAMGAIASGGVKALNQSLIKSIGVSEEQIETVAEKEHKELQRREGVYRQDREPPAVEGRQVILVDDGIATGATMRSAVLALRELRPERLMIATPVSSVDAKDSLARQVDEFHSLMTPEPFLGIGAWYDDFAQLKDEEVVDILEKAQEELPAQ